MAGIPAPPSVRGGGRSTTTTLPSGGDPSSWIIGNAGSSPGVSGVAEWKAKYGGGGNPSLEDVADETVYLSIPEGEGYTRSGPQLGGGATAPQKRTVRELLSEITTWDAPRVREMQRQMFAAGYYGNTKPEDIALGTVDRATRNAWGGLLSDMVFQGEGTGLDDFLSERARARAASLGEGAGVDLIQKPEGRAARIGGGGVQEIMLSDPAGLRSAADQIAQAVLGRNATDAEKARYAPIIQEAERSAQARAFAVAESQDRRMFDAQNAAAGPPGMVSMETMVAPGTGGIIHPLGGGKGRLSPNFGQNRGTHKHGGVDISAPLGTPLVAVVPGVVVGKTSAADGNAAGNRIHIKGDDGRFYSYFHMDNGGFNSVQNGSRVSPGQVIGAVGNTGRSTGPHLHFEVNTKGIGVASGRIDPAAVLSGAGTATPTSQAIVNTPAGASVTEDTYIDPAQLETTRVDAGARLEEMFEQDNPGEAGAKDISDAYNQFRSMLGAGGGVPA